MTMGDSIILLGDSRDGRPSHYSDQNNSDINTIFVQGPGQKVTTEPMTECFKQIGTIETNKPIRDCIQTGKLTSSRVKQPRLGRICRQRWRRW